MAADSGPQRVAPLKTYSKRVKRSFPLPACKKLSEKVFLDQRKSTEGVQQRVIVVEDENHSHEATSGSPSKKHQQDKPASSTTIADPQRQPLLDLDLNCHSTPSSGPLATQSQKGDSASLHKTLAASQGPASQKTSSKHVKKGPRGHSSEETPTNDHHTAKYSLQAPDKDILQTANESSPSKTRRNKYTNTPYSSHRATDEKLVLESVFTPHLTSFSKKRRQPEEPESGPPAAKKVKRSSIKSFFKPIPSSSSPSTTRSVSIFSDSLDTPTSPPTSPLSEGESPKYQPSRKKTRRNLSLKPALLPPVTSPSSAIMPCDRVMDIRGIVSLQNHRSFFEDNCIEVSERLQDGPDWPGVERDSKPKGSAAWSNQGVAEFASGDLGVVSMITDDAVWSNPNVASANIEGSGWHANRSRSSQKVAPSDYSSDWVTTSGETETDDGVTHSNPIDIPPKKMAPIHVRYHQLRFITERNPNIECDECGFLFNRTIKSEVKDHSIWHRDHTRGNHLMKGPLSKPLWEQTDIDGSVHRIQVNRHGASAKEREWYENALEISMKRGLDGPFTNDLWRDINDPADPKPGAQVPQYKVYVYIIGVQVVSVILAKRIVRAGAYYLGPKTHDKNGKLATPDHTKLQEYVNVDHPFPVMASIDRLWTEGQHRRKGYATQLLDYVRKDFIPSVKLHKCQVAFSVPTADGHSFAAKYYSEVFADAVSLIIDVDDARVVVEDGKLIDKWSHTNPLVRKLPEKEWTIEQKVEWERKCYVNTTLGDRRRRRRR